MYYMSTCAFTTDRLVCKFVLPFLHNYTHTIIHTHPHKNTRKQLYIYVVNLKCVLNVLRIFQLNVNCIYKLISRGKKDNEYLNAMAHKSNIATQPSPVVGCQYNNI